MRMKKAVPILLCTLLLAITLSSCFFPGYQVSSGNPTAANPAETGSTATNPAVGDEDAKESATDPHITDDSDPQAGLHSTSIDDVKVYNLGEAATIQTDNSDKSKLLSVTVTGVEMTKELGEYKPSYIPKVLGFDGTQITTEYSFVFVNLKVTNLSEDKQVFGAINLGIYVIGDDGYFRSQWGVDFFFDKSEGAASDYGYYLMEPGETITAVLGYFVFDGPDLSQGFIDADLIGGTPTGESEWFALTERG